MTFTDLCERLLTRLQRLLDGGAITESALARRLGISQSHLHNTLKGVRSLTFSSADRILTSMQWTAFDLMEDEELREESNQRRIKSRELKWRMKSLPVKALRDQGLSECGSYAAAPRALLAGMEDPAVLTLSGEIDAGGAAQIGDLLLADLACKAPPSEGLYLCQSKGEILLRWVRRGARGLYLLSRDNWQKPIEWRRDENPRLIARVHAIAQPTGTFQPPVPPSFAN